MARPERNSVDYFPFYCKEGKAMFYIENKYGNDGYAVWIKLLRLLAVTDYHYLNLQSKPDLMFASSKCRVSEETLISVVNDLCELGEFDKTLWEENKVIWSDKFMEGIKDAYDKRNNNPLSYEQLLDRLTVLGVRKQSKLPSKGDVKPQTKVNYTKQKKTKANIPELSEVFEHSEKKAKEYKLLFNKHIIEAKYQSWVDNGWKDGNNNKIVNWKSKINNTIVHILKPEQTQSKGIHPHQMYTL